MPPLSTTSTIPLFKAALYSRLAADANIVASGAVVTYGNPYPVPTPDEWIWLGSTRSLGQTAAAQGLQRREDHYTLDIAIGKRADARTTQQVVTERAFLITSFIELSIRAWGGPGLPTVPDPFSYSTTGVRSVEVTSVDHKEDLSPDKRFAVVGMTLTVKARI